MSDHQYTRCALNEKVDKNARTCIKKSDLVEYYGNDNDDPKTMETRLIKEVCGGIICSDDVFAAKLSTSANSRLRYMAEVAYKPKWPTDPGKETNWPLTNTEIDHIQAQFRYRQPNYYPLTTWYVDFMTTFPPPNVYLEFDYLKYSSMNNNRYVGFIYNTDTYPNSGIHWISVLIDTKLGVFEVFDSFGRDPAPEISEYYDFVSKKLAPKFPKLKLVVNKTVHQSYSSDECGIYALNFIWLRLSGMTMEQINEHKIKSDFMREFRHILFRR